MASNLTTNVKVKTFLDLKGDVLNFDVCILVIVMC